jgi:hypothetical protein
MTDNEIIKALPTVAYGGHSCNLCKHKWDKGEVRCGLKGCRITREALDLINRQKAEVERLKEGIKFERERVDNIPNLLLQAKSEAIREFAERLKNRYFSSGMDMFIRDLIDNLVKEMVGDE